MKNHALPMIVIGIVMLILASGLILSGCGSNEAQEAQTVTAADEMTLAEAEAIAASEAELENREQKAAQLAEQAELQMLQIEARLDAVRSREAAVEAREDSVVPSEPDAIPAFEFQLEPSPDRQPEPVMVMVKLPVNTQLSLQFIDELSSETSIPGDPVRALITEDIVGDGLVAIPAGSEVFGTVVEATPQKKIGGQARLTVRFDEIETPGGYRAAIQATLDAEGKNQKKRDAAVIGGSTAGGAILGRVIGDDSKSAVIGGILGAAAGAIAARRNKGDPVIIGAGSTAVIALELPIHVAITDAPTPTAIARN